MTFGGAVNEYSWYVAQFFYEAAEAKLISSDAGIPPEEIHWNQSARRLWVQVAEVAIRAGKFDSLHAAIKSSVDEDAFCGELDRLRQSVLAQGLSGGYASRLWYTSPDPCLARLVGPMARRAVFNRVDLRRLCAELIVGLPVAFIAGERYSGRSHSWWLIQHVAHTVGFVPLHLDIARENPAIEYNAARLIADIADQLGIADFDATIRDTAQRSTSPRILTNRLIGRLPSDHRRRWLFIDGLDRPNVESDAVELAERLAEAAANARLLPLQLIIAGYAGSLLDDSALERIQPIGRPEVESFFRDVADHLGANVTEDGMQRLLSELYAGLGDPVDLPTLEREAARMARIVLAGVP